MPPSRKAGSSHSSSHRSSPRRSSSSHSSSHRSSSRASSSHSSRSSYSSSSSYRSSSYSHRGGYRSYGSSSGGLLGALFGLNSIGNSGSDAYSGTASGSAAPFQREYFCKYCDTKSIVTWNSGEALVCPVCGAPVSQTDIDAMQGDAYEELATYRAGNLPSDQSSRRSSSVVGKVVIIAAVIFIMGYVMNLNLSGRLTSTDNTSAYSKSVEDSIYVPALSRNVKWNDEYDSYYDEQTDCYFLLNTDMDPDIWQYWYEGISSDYGDYGWMEWDEKENRWYINTIDDDWEPLPAKYDTARLWHM